MQGFQGYIYQRNAITEPTYIHTGVEQFEQVISFNYLGTMVNTDNSIEGEIKERIAAGNRTFHVHKKNYSNQS